MQGCTLLQKHIVTKAKLCSKAMTANANIVPFLLRSSWLDSAGIAMWSEAVTGLDRVTHMVALPGNAADT